MESEEGSLKDLLNLRETLQQAIANIPALSPSPPPDALTSALEDLQGPRQEENSSTGTMIESSTAAFSQPDPVSSAGYASQGTESSLPASSTMSPPQTQVDNVDLAKLTDRIRVLIKDRPLSQSIPNCPTMQEISLLRTAFTVMQAPWKLSLREPYPPSAEVEHKFLNRVYPQEAENRVPLTSPQRLELQLFWYQEKIAGLIDKQQAVMNCLNHETLTNGDQTDKALMLVGESHHIEDQLRFWDLEQGRLIEMVKIVKMIPKPIASKLDWSSKDSASTSSAAVGVGTSFSDDNSLTSNWCYSELGNRVDSIDMKQNESCLHDYTGVSSSSGSICKQTEHPVSPLRQEDFLNNLGLISQSALQLHLSIPKKVERRRRAVTANPKYTSNGFVEISQLATRLTRGKGKEAVSKVLKLESTLAAMEPTSEKDVIRTDQKKPIDAVCAVCEKKGWETYCTNCQSKFHGDCVRLTGSKAPVPKCLPRCPECVQSISKPPIQDRKPGSTPSSISILTPDKSLRRKKLSGDCDSAQELSVSRKPVEIHELAKPMRTRSNPLKRPNLASTAGVIDSKSRYDRSLTTDATEPPAKIRKTRSSSIGISETNVGIKPSLRRKTVCGQQQKSNSSSLTSGSPILRPDNAPSSIFEETMEETQEYNEVIVPRQLRKQQKPAVKESSVISSPVNKKPRVKRRVIAKSISPAPVIEVKSKRSKISKRGKPEKSELQLLDPASIPLCDFESPTVLINDETHTNLANVDYITTVTTPSSSCTEEDAIVIHTNDDTELLQNMVEDEQISESSELSTMEVDEKRSLSTRNSRKRKIGLSPKKISPKKSSQLKCDAISLSMSAAAHSVFLGKKKNPEQEPLENDSGFNDNENIPLSATVPLCDENVQNGLKDRSLSPSAFSYDNLFEAVGTEVNVDVEQKNNLQNISEEVAGESVTQFFKDAGICSAVELGRRTEVKLDTVNFQIANTEMDLNDSGKDQLVAKIPDGGVLVVYPQAAELVAKPNFVSLAADSLIKPNSGEFDAELTRKLDEYLIELKAASASPESGYEIPDVTDQLVKECTKPSSFANEPLTVEDMQSSEAHEMLMRELFSTPAMPVHFSGPEPVVDPPAPQSVPQISNTVDEDDDDCVVIEEHIFTPRGSINSACHEVRDEASSSSESSDEEEEEEEEEEGEEEEEEEEDEENESTEELEELLSIPDYTAPSPEETELMTKSVDDGEKEDEDEKEGDSEEEEEDDVDEEEDEEEEKVDKDKKHVDKGKEESDEEEEVDEEKDDSDEEEDEEEEKVDKDKNNFDEGEDDSDEEEEVDEGKDDSDEEEDEEEEKVDKDKNNFDEGEDGSDEEEEVDEGKDDSDEEEDDDDEEEKKLDKEKNVDEGNEAIDEEEEDDDEEEEEDDEEEEEEELQDV